MKSFIHVLGISPQITERTTNDIFLDTLFNNSDLLKMVIQFTPYIKNKTISCIQHINGISSTVAYLIRNQIYSTLWSFSYLSNNNKEDIFT